MRIGLIGYGRMGQIILPIAEDRGHDVPIKTQSAQELELIKDVDIAIDFSVPSAAVSNIAFCNQHNVPLVMGTTGWYDQIEEITEQTLQANNKLLWASNFSIGVNLFFELNKQLAKLMDGQPYQAIMDETHHIQKLDAPSGTAISLANDIIDNHTQYNKWTCFEEDKGEFAPNDQSDSINIVSKRVPKVTGTHKVAYHSPIDTISITHQAHNRSGFALGSVIAAEWLYKKQKSGVYTMADVLKL